MSSAGEFRSQAVAVVPEALFALWDNTSSSVRLRKVEPAQATQVAHFQQSGVVAAGTLTNPYNPELDICARTVRTAKPFSGYPIVNLEQSRP